LTGQRISKVVQTLRFLENHVLAMIDIWGLDDGDSRERTPEAEKAKSHLLNGPARKGEGIDQSQVDLVIDFDKDSGNIIEGECKPATPQNPPMAGEVEASAFATPADLNIDALDETKAQALFS